MEVKETQEERQQRLKDEYRKTVEETARESWRSYDKTVLLISGGAMVLAIQFVAALISKQGVKVVTDSWMLTVGSLCLAGSMLLILASFFTSGKSQERTLDEFDADKRVTGGRWEVSTRILNALSGVFVLVGVVLLLLFVSWQLG